MNDARLCQVAVKELELSYYNKEPLYFLYTHIMVA